MKNLFVFVLIMLLGYQVSEAQQVNQQIYDSTLNEVMLTGPCTRDALLENDFGSIFKNEYKLYKPSKQVINELKKKVGNIDEIVIVFGVWCGDSQEQVPHFMKIADQAGIPSKHLKIIAVNRKKDAVVEDISSYNIERVPTFIVYKNGKELGRIIESPKNTLEKDLLAIAKHGEKN